MKNLKLLWNYMNENKIKYLLSIISTALAVALALTVPLILQVVIDYILVGKEVQGNIFVEKLFGFLGGTTYLIDNLWLTGLLVIVITAVQGIFLYYKGKLSAEASEDVAKNLRERLYNHIQHLTYAYHKNADTGDLIQRSTSDIETIRRFLSVQMVEVGRAVFMVGISLYVMINLNVKMTLIAMATTPVLFVFSYMYFKVVQKSFKISDESEAELSTVIQENLNGVRVVKAFGREKFEIEKFREKNNQYKVKTYKVIMNLAYYWSISDLLTIVQIALVVVASIYYANQGLITLGTAVVFINYIFRIIWPIKQLGRILADLGKALVSTERIQEILDEEREVEKPGEIKPEINGEIEFKNVSFEYPDDKNHKVLENVSFKVKKGETIAIVGKTGSGKSSLVHLLPRLYDIEKGEILIDGHNINTIQKKWLRKNVGIVLQEPFLYSTTIQENISFQNESNIKDVHDAARIASVHHVVEEFDQGYDTVIGEKGVTLSGGQKQRIAIARTIINNYPILIFDDSLSAVDTETDIAIRKALGERKKDVTTFIISHRISSIYDADKIIVMEKCKIKEMGKHEDLIQKEGIYKRIYDIQNVKEFEVEVERRESDGN